VRAQARIRPVAPDDADAVWRLLEPVLRDGETYALPHDMTRSDALAYWLGSDHRTFVAEQPSARITFGQTNAEAGRTSPTAPMSLTPKHRPVALRVREDLFLSHFTTLSQRCPRFD
jgi:hypothetical protein